MSFMHKMYNSINVGVEIHHGGTILVTTYSLGTGYNYTFGRITHFVILLLVEQSDTPQAFSRPISHHNF